MARFEKGQSGNPKGRPKGVPDKRSKYRAELQKHADELITSVVEQALTGDTAAMRICIDRIVPTLKATGSTINIRLSGDLSDKGSQVLAAMSEGKLSPEEGNSLLASLQAQARLIESDELVERVEKLERASGEH